MKQKQHPRLIDFFFIVILAIACWSFVKLISQMTRLQKISILRNAFEMILNFTIIYEYYGIGILRSQEKKEMGILSSLQCKMQKLVTIPKIIGKKMEDSRHRKSTGDKQIYRAYITNKVRTSSLKHVTKAYKT